jgi:hypothetical protein
MNRINAELQGTVGLLHDQRGVVEAQTRDLEAANAQVQELIAKDAQTTERSEELLKALHMASDVAEELGDDLERVTADWLQAAHDLHEAKVLVDALHAAQSEATGLGTEYGDMAAADYVARSAANTPASARTSPLSSYQEGSATRIIEWEIQKGDEAAGASSAARGVTTLNRNRIGFPTPEGMGSTSLSPNSFFDEYLQTETTLRRSERIRGPTYNPKVPYTPP